MRVFFRVCVVSFAAVLVFSCRPVKTTTSPAKFSTLTPVSETLSVPPALTDIPKQKGLIFIEFFAGT